MKIFNFLRKKNIDSSCFRSVLDIGSQAFWSSRDYTSFVHEGYIKNVIAYQSINMIATGLSSIPLDLYRIVGDERIKVFNHDLLKLLYRPNNFVSKTDFMQNILCYKLISGNAYILRLIVDDMPQELHLLRPDKVSVIVNDNKDIIGYSYADSTKDEVKYAADGINGSSDILHLKNFHPLDDCYGLSKFEPANYSIDQHNQALSWNQSLLQNGARPSGALIVKTSGNMGGNLTEEQFRRIKDQLDEVYSGAKNSGKPLLLEGGMEWKEMGISPKDMDFIHMKHSSARDIALAFGVPPQLLGIPGDNTYSNLAEARIALWEQTILPLLDDLVEKLNNWLVPFFGEDLMLTYDKNSISALAPKRAKLWELLGGSSFMTINEKRSFLGLSPIKNGDILDS